MKRGVLDAIGCIWVVQTGVQCAGSGIYTALGVGLKG